MANDGLDEEGEGERAKGDDGERVNRFRDGERANQMERVQIKAEVVMSESEMRSSDCGYEDECWEPG